MDSGVTRIASATIFFNGIAKMTGFEGAQLQLRRQASGLALLQDPTRAPTTMYLYR